MHYTSNYYGSWPSFCTQKSFVHKLHVIPSIFVLATKQTLLSIEYWLIMHSLDSFQIVIFTGPEGHTLDPAR